MINFEKMLYNAVQQSIKELYGKEVEQGIQIQKTKKEFVGDFTVVVFPLLRFSHKSPEDTARELGEQILKTLPEAAGFNVIKGFLNIELSVASWLNFFREILPNEKFGLQSPDKRSKKIVIEFSSPNTNKPLHLGHIRNNLLGWSVAQILEACGHEVVRVNLVNDRGIHICKSMLAWQKESEGATPESASLKGDHFVGNYYVAFDKAYKKQVATLQADGMSEKEAKEQAPWMQEARQMLKKWENNDAQVRALWKKMNAWVYEGFEETYRQLGITFDKTYYESETYLRGKSIIEKAYANGLLAQKEDGSIFIDLTSEGLDEKILLRSDGTALYMTQDIGTALIRYEDYSFDESVYVVGNEQDYHFKVLKIVLEKLGYPWASAISHLSYGMVELPDGKMKSREGTVVDADDLIAEMILTAREKAEELGKLDEFSEEEKEEIYRKVALGALKYFILKPDAKKNMTFHPHESIDFNGNTGPFIQYTYVRILSMLQRAEYLPNQQEISPEAVSTLSTEDLSLLHKIYDFPEAVQEAGERRTPSVLANYVYDLAKDYNRFYHEIPPLLKEKDEVLKLFRLSLSQKTAEIIKNAMHLLGIEMPEKM
ncbi:MAG: arginine--tRNA ligase [Bacteroidia bacterium]|nr:MAG: arginine--tRNA ligase [Bacteroidia bacterium]